MAYLKGHSGLEDGELRPNLFMLLGSDAVWHLLHVASGLDSLVIGEGQILSQVKACYSHAISTGGEEAGDEAPGSAGKVLGRLLNTAVMSGKFVRSETGIAQGAVSISSAAVELAVLKSVADLDKPLSEARITIIGAGKMSRLLITHLASHGVTKLTLLNRSRPRAEEMAAEYPDVDIRVGLMDELWSTMETTDMAFTSTSATGCILTQQNLGERVWGATGQKLVLIDISVPRNVESECNDVPGVRAYNVDDLKQVVAANQAKRRHKIIEAEVLLRVELQKFEAWQESLKYVPTISRLQQKMEKIRAAETQKVTKKALKGLSDKERQAVETVTKGIINKLLHSPMSYLRSDSKGDKATVAQIEEIFGLQD
jgi:glutamyl-tRNA reductase